MINRQSIQRTALLASLLCASSLPLLVNTDAQAQYQRTDRRMTDSPSSSSFSQTVERENREREAIIKAEQRLTATWQRHATKPDQYISALLSMASLYSRQQKLEIAKRYLDQAIYYYEAYTPKSGTDYCIRSLVSELNMLKGQELDVRLDKIIKRSELFCKSTSARNERDHSILELTRTRPTETVNLLQKLIKVREQLQPQTGATPDSLYRGLSWAYEKKGDEKMAAWALEKAIEKSPTIKARFHYQIKLAELYLRTSKFDLARQEWLRAGTTVHWQQSYGHATYFASLAKEFWRQGDRTTCKEILLKSLAHSTNSQVLSEVDETLGELVRNFDAIKAYATTEALLSKRIEAGLRIGHDSNITEWQMQLSELYFATNRQAQSEKLYKQARESAFLQREALTGIDLRRRRTLQQAGADGALKAQSQNSPQNTRVKSITFPHVLYAFSELSLNNNTSTGSCDSRLKGDKFSMFRPKDENGDICSPGRINIEGNTKVAGSIYAIPTQEATKQFAAWSRSGNTQIIPQVVMQPNSLSIASSTGRTKLGDYKGEIALAGGDYEATSISSLSLEKNLAKPVRLFITDNSTAEKYAARLGSFLSSQPPENLQIWYLGYRPVILEHNSDVNAVVYAPYSSLTMGDNNCRFHGAIVANKITAIGNVSAIYDKALEGKVFTPSQP